MKKIKRSQNFAERCSSIADARAKREQQEWLRLSEEMAPKQRKSKVLAKTAMLMTAMLATLNY